METKFILIYELRKKIKKERKKGRKEKKGRRMVALGTDNEKN